MTKEQMEIAESIVKRHYCDWSYDLWTQMHNEALEKIAAEVCSEAGERIGYVVDALMTKCHNASQDALAEVDYADWLKQINEHGFLKKEIV